MKKISKILITSILLSFTLSILTPTIINAEDEEKTEEVEKEEEKKEKEEEKKEEDEGQKMKVDEDNEDPFISGEELKEDQSKREKEIIETPIETPASVTGEKYEGSGTVVDFTTTGSRAFYTVRGKDNEVYYIIIDLDKMEDNVYFLSDINGEELSVNEVSQQQEVPNRLEPEQPEEIEQTPKEENIVKSNNKNSNTTFYVMLAIIAIGFIVYHLFFGKLKHIKIKDVFKKSKTEQEETQEDNLDFGNVHGEEDVTGYATEEDDE